MEVFFYAVKLQSLSFAEPDLDGNSKQNQSQSASGPDSDRLTQNEMGHEQRNDARDFTIFSSFSCESSTDSTSLCNIIALLPVQFNG